MKCRINDSAWTWAHYLHISKEYKKLHPAVKSASGSRWISVFVRSTVWFVAQASEKQLSNNYHLYTQISVTPLHLPSGGTDVGLRTLLCPIIFMQMRAKSGEIGGHLPLLVLISNECYIVYIMHEVLIFTLWPWRQGQGLMQHQKVLIFYRVLKVSAKWETSCAHQH